MLFTSAFARDVRDVKPENGRKRATHVKFRGVAKGKDGNGKWRQRSATLECEKGIGRNAEQKTATNIQRALDEWREELNAEANTPDEAKESIAAYAEAYIALRERVQVDGMRKLERSTAMDYRKSLRRLGGIGEVALCEATTKQVRDWERKQLENGMSVYQVRKCHRLLHLVFQHAYVEEYIDANPVARVTPPSMPKKEPNSLTQEGMQFVTAQLESMQPTPVVVAAYLGLHAGLRCAEACALRWSDVDFTRGEITVRGSIGVAKGGSYFKGTKTGKVRVVDFDTEMMAVMLRRRRDLMLEQRDGIITNFDELYVCGNVDGGWAVPTVISRKWAEFSEAWGLVGTSGEHVCFHGLRHSYVTAQLATGSSVRDVADNAGHASTQMTVDTYASSLRKGKKDAARKSGAYMRPQADADVYTLRTGTEG